MALNTIAITTTLHASGVECINTMTHEIVGPCTCINTKTHEIVVPCTGHVINLFQALHYALDATWKERHRVDFQLHGEELSNQDWERWATSESHFQATTKDIVR